MAMRRYLDNAATSFPKPPGVGEAIAAYVRDVGVSAGRGSYREAVAAGRILDDCRALLRELLGAGPRDHVVLAFIGTDAIHLALHALLRPGDHVVASSLEHNAVVRPLSALSERGAIAAWDVVPADPQTSLLSPEAVRAALRPETRLMVLNHVSNVTGAIQPLREIAAVCRERGVLLLVDAAQSAGHLPLHFAADGVDLLATSGHKGLLGPHGTAALLVRDGLAERLQSVREGGTGSQSEDPHQPRHLPELLESGTHNTAGLAGWREALRWMRERGVAALRAHDERLMRRFDQRLAELPHIRRHGPSDIAQRCAVYSLSIDGFDCQEVATILDERFGLLTRAGLHCAPLAHETIGTLAGGGTLRISFGPFVGDEEVDAAACALAALRG
jgi:cysteine desulfurase family protein